MYINWQNVPPGVIILILYSCLKRYTMRQRGPLLGISFSLFPHSKTFFESKCIFFMNITGVNTFVYIRNKDSKYKYKDKYKYKYKDKDNIKSNQSLSFSFPFLPSFSISFPLLPSPYLSNFILYLPLLLGYARAHASKIFSDRTAEEK